MKINNGTNTVQNQVLYFLAEKPIWVFWLVYLLLSIVLFSIFYAAVYFMTLQWWIPVIAVVTVGIIWGSIAFTREHKKILRENI